MTRKLTYALAGVAALAAIAFFILHPGSGASPDPAPTEGDAGESARQSPQPASPVPAPRRASEARMAEDPEGDLRLEGQVIDGDDLPVAGAEIRIDANPPRTATTEGDGAFAIDGLVGRNYEVTAVAGARVGGPVSHRLTETSPPVIIRVRAGAILRVDVADEEGRPIADADVSFRGSVDLEAETDAEGRAILRGATPGFGVVTASAEGYGLVREAIQVPEKARAELSVPLTLPAGAPIRGRVLTAGGDPVEGARVVAEDASAMFSLADPETEGTLSGEDGGYELSAVASGNVRVAARHENHPPASSELVATDGDSAVTGVDIELAPGASVSGRVVSDSGEPAAWASVRAGAKGQSPGGDDVRAATADEKGRFTLEGLPRTSLQIVASSKEKTSAIRELDLDERAQVSDIELVLEGSARIAGTVRDEEGEPVADAYVVAYPDVWEDGAKAAQLRRRGRTSTGGGGKFELTELPEGTYRLRASRAPPRWRGGGAPATEARTGREDVALTLATEGTIKGRVVLDGGDSPAAFTVAMGGGAGTPFSGRDQGAFEVEKIEPGTHTLAIRGPEFSRRILRGVEVEPGEVTDVGTVNVTRGRSVSGRVYDSSGAPVTEATVIIGTQLFGDGETLSGGMEAFAEQRGIRQAETDSEGRYEIAGIGSAEQALAAEHPDAGRSPALAIPAGSESLSLDLELKPFGSVRGRATVNGEPREGISIMASGKTDGDQHVMVSSGGDGSFVIERLPAGTHRLNAMHGSGVGAQTAGKDVDIVPEEEAHVELDIELGEIELDVSVGAEGEKELAASQLFLIEGVVRAETGADLTRLFQEGSGSMAMSFAMGETPASFENVLPGSYSLCALPLAGDLDDPNVMRELQERRNELPVHCRRRDISASPEEQSITLKVPAPPSIEGQAESPDEENEP